MGHVGTSMPSLSGLCGCSVELTAATCVTALCALRTRVLKCRSKGNASGTSVRTATEESCPQEVGHKRFGRDVDPEAQDSEDSDSEEEMIPRPRFGKVQSLPARLECLHGTKSLPFSAAHLFQPGSQHSAAGALHHPHSAHSLPELTAPPVSISYVELGQLFTKLEGQVKEHDIQFVQTLLLELNERYHVGLRDSDADRLHAMLTHGSNSMTRESFVTILRDLLCALQGCSGHLSLRQLRVVMATAFERFDMDGDGNISVQEFASALRSYDIKLGPSETLVLFRFLSPETMQSHVIAREDLASVPTIEKRCHAVVQGVQQTVAESTGWSSAAKMLEGLKDMSSPASSLSALLASGGDEILMATSELATTFLALGLAFLHAHLHMHGHDGACDALEQLHDVMDIIWSALEDLAHSGFLLPVSFSCFLGALKAVHADDLVALDEDEALLYARNFHDKDCSVGLFQKLLACGGCRWGQALAGEKLTSTQAEEFGILVRGRAWSGTSQVEMPPGAIISSAQEVTACEAVTFIAWDKEKLIQFIQSSEDSQLVSLASEMMVEETEMPGACRSDRSEACCDWLFSVLSPLHAALSQHARQKGFARWMHLHAGIQHILERDSSTREKIDKCRALVLESGAGLFASASAAWDLLGAGSLLIALLHSQSLSESLSDLSADDCLQLAPMMALLNLVRIEVVRRRHSTAHG